MFRHYRLLIALFAFVVLSLLAAGVSAQQPNGIIANASRINLRSGPGANYAIVVQMSAGQQVFLLGTNADGSWINVQLVGGQTGWVRATYVQVTGNVGQLPVNAPTGLSNATVTAYFLNIRNGPGANFEIVGRLSRGQAFDVNGRNADASWVRINVPGGVQNGWVSGRYVASNIRVWDLPVVSNTGVFPTFPQPVPTGGQTGVVTAGNLNVRYGPGTGFGTFDRLANGEGVSLIGRNGAGNWLLVQLANGVTGWVNAGFIRTSFPIASLPIRG